MRALHRLVRGARYLIDAFDEAVYPQHCLLTGEPLSPKESSTLPLVSHTGLDRCEPAPSPTELMLTLQRHIEADDIAISKMVAVWGHSPESDIGKLVYAIKYKNHQSLAISLGKWLAEVAKSEVAKYDGIVPVPIHAARRRERGYNQAELIARGMSEVMGVPMLNVLERRKNTTSQTTLSEASRLSNVEAAFTLREGVGETLRGTRVLVVDDVVTTGATLNQCAWQLLDGGCSRADAATLCATL